MSARPTYADVPLLIGADDARRLLLTAMRLVETVEADTHRYGDMRYSDAYSALCCAVNQAKR